MEVLNLLLTTRTKKSKKATKRIFKKSWALIKFIVLKYEEKLSNFAKTAVFYFISTSTSYTNSKKNSPKHLVSSEKCCIFATSNKAKRKLNI